MLEKEVHNLKSLKIHKDKALKYLDLALKKLEIYDDSNLKAASYEKIIKKLRASY